MPDWEDLTRFFSLRMLISISTSPNVDVMCVLRLGKKWGCGGEEETERQIREILKSVEFLLSNSLSSAKQILTDYIFLSFFLSSETI